MNTEAKILRDEMAKKYADSFDLSSTEKALVLSGYKAGYNAGFTLARSIADRVLEAVSKLTEFVTEDLEEAVAMYFSDVADDGTENEPHDRISKEMIAKQLRREREMLDGDDED